MGAVSLLFHGLRNWASLLFHPVDEAVTEASRYKRREHRHSHLGSRSVKEFTAVFQHCSKDKDLKVPHIAVQATRHFCSFLHLTVALFWAVLCDLFWLLKLKSLLQSHQFLVGEGQVVHFTSDYWSRCSHKRASSLPYFLLTEARFRGFSKPNPFKFAECVERLQHIDACNQLGHIRCKTLTYLHRISHDSWKLSSKS